MFKNLFGKSRRTTVVRGNNIVTVNEKTISVRGNSVSVINDKVYVDGKLVEEGLSGNLTVVFEGDVANLRVDGDLTINGNVQGGIDAGGSVKVSGDVGGDVDAGGSVSCGNVHGDIDAGGSISCGNVGSGIRVSR